MQASYKITEKRLKPREENERGAHSEKKMLDVDIPGKRRKGRPNIRWKDACRRDMTEAGLKENNATNSAAWRNKIIM